jgi:hypothetical protein
MAQVKRTKAKDTNTELRSLSNTRTWADFIRKESVIAFPDKDAYRQRLMHTLLEWADQESSIEINDFIFEMKMRRQDLYDLAQRFEDFAEVYEYAKMRVGSRRRKGALTKKFDKDVVHRDEHVYEPNRHEVNVYHNNLKKDIQNDNTTKVIVLSQLETGELVPISGKKDDHETNP